VSAEGATEATLGADPATGSRPADPVDAYVTTLSDALQGPARVKSRLVEEIRGGLNDAVAAHTRGGMPYEHAAELAVRDFGAPDLLTPTFQRELTIAQARHTAFAAALTVPFAIACWLLIWAGVHDNSWHLPRATQLLTVHLVAVAVTAAVLAAVSLAATGRLARWLPTPNRLPLAVAWTGTAASVAMAIAAFLLVALSIVATNGPAAVAAAVLAAASHAVMAASARTCRQCARLPIT
jgi:hypothetical protein